MPSTPSPPLYRVWQVCYNPHSWFQSRGLRLNVPDSISASAAMQDQDSRFAAAFQTIEQAIADRAFPAATLAVTRRSDLVALKAFGQFTFDAESPPVTAATLFDIASVTKVAATTAMAMLLYQHGLLDLDAPVGSIVPEFLSPSAVKPDPRRRAVTIEMLLAHSSGLQAHEKFYLTTSTREELLTAVYSAPLTTDPGTRTEYSDLGFILLGVLLEHLAGEPLDAFCQRKIFGPLGMISTTFNLRSALRQMTPPTADERPWGTGTLVSEQAVAHPPLSGSPLAARSTFRGRIIQGEVQDENASVFGGVAGHAGLFSTAEDLSRFARALLAATPFRPATIALFTRRKSSPPGTSRALGWDTPSAPSQSGKYFSPLSFGHLGFTGTSLWIDPERELSVTLLTNRTWPDCSNSLIRAVRPQVHDRIVEAI